MLDKVLQHSYYRNIKTGKTYYVWAIAKHSENPEELLVIYSDGSKNEVWARPLELFREKFEDSEKEQPQ
jgi:hypothetical protein